MTGFGLKNIVIVIGVVLAIVGISIKNWQLAVIGNTVSIIAFLFI